MKERGGVLLEMTLSMVMLVIFAGGIIDIGNSIYEESQLTDFLQKLTRDLAIVDEIVINGDPATEYTMDEFLESLNLEVDERFISMGINPNNFEKHIQPLSYQPENSTNIYAYISVGLKRVNKSIFFTKNSPLSICVALAIKINIKNPEATYGVMNEEGYEDYFPYLMRQEDYANPC